MAVALPIAARADFSETITLQINQTIHFDTGAVGTSGGDLLFSRTGLAPQGTAKARAIGAREQVVYDTLGESFFRSQAASATAAPIPLSTLVPAEMFLVVTNSGKLAKGLVVSNQGPMLWLEITTFGANGPAGVPMVQWTVNNSSGIRLGFPNSGIAPSALFVVQGSGLSDAGDPVLQSSADPGLPLSLNGTSVAVTVNGATTHPALYYTSPTQVAAVLPAGTPTGQGTITVTYRGQSSAPSPIVVVPAALGINTYNGLAVATDAVSGALLSYTNAAQPGGIVTLWATGLGADAADSDTTFSAAPHPVSTPLQIYIGGMAASIQYQGSAGFPGVNQINVIIPDNAPRGCWVSLAAVAGGVVSNAVVLPIQDGGGVCVDVESGLRGSQIAPSGGSSTFRTGLISLIHLNSPDKNGGRTIENTTDAAFVRYIGLSYTAPNQVSPGSCIVYSPIASGIPNLAGLDAGTIKLAGPGGLAASLTPMSKGVSYALLSGTAIPAGGGTFTFTGAGGADVGPFTVTMNLAPLLTWTNPPSSVDQSSDLTVTWTGGNPGSYVLINGGTSMALGGTETFQCKAPVDAGQFTVPSYILKGLPAGSGSMAIQNIVLYPLPASGVDISTAVSYVGYTVNTTYATGGGGARR